MLWRRPGKTDDLVTSGAQQINVGYLAPGGHQPAAGGFQPRIGHESCYFEAPGCGIESPRKAIQCQIDHLPGHRVGSPRSAVQLPAGSPILLQVVPGKNDFLQRDTGRCLRERGIVQLVDNKGVGIG